MAQYFSGQHGQIWIKANAGVAADGTSTPQIQQVGSLRDWQLSMQMNVLETTTMESTDRTLLHGVRSYNGSATMLYYRENGNTTSNVKRMIQNTFVESTNTNPVLSNFGKNSQPTIAVLKLRLFDSNSYDLDCMCFITSFSIQCAVGEVVSANIGFEGTGAPTELNMIA